MDDGGTRAPHVPPRRMARASTVVGENVRKRVGMRHHPLADLFNAFNSADLAIEHMAEVGDRPVHAILGIRAPGNQADSGLAAGSAAPALY